MTELYYGSTPAFPKYEADSAFNQLIVHIIGWHNRSAYLDTLFFLIQGADQSLIRVTSLKVDK